MENGPKRSTPPPFTRIKTKKIVILSNQIPETYTDTYLTALHDNHKNILNITKTHTNIGRITDRAVNEVTNPTIWTLMVPSFPHQKQGKEMVTL